MHLLVVIVNYRTAPTTLEALSVLMPQIAEGAVQVEVVDNASGDGSFELLTQGIAERGWQDRVRVTVSARNGGFGAGNNLAIRRALQSSSPPDYFYLLNPDAFVEPGAVQALVQFLEHHPEAGIVGSRIHSVVGGVDVSAFRFPNLLGEFEGGMKLGLVTQLLAPWVVAPPMQDYSCETDWVSGASMMVRREVFEHVGLFDEEFFLYFEETDLCRRAKAAGFVTYHVHESLVRHIGSVSTGMGDTQRRMPKYWFDSRARYFEKHHGAFYLLGSNLAFILGFSMWRVRRALQGKPDEDPPYLLRDFTQYVVAQLRERRKSL